MRQDLQQIATFNLQKLLDASVYFDPFQFIWAFFLSLFSQPSPLPAATPEKVPSPFLPPPLTQTIVSFTNFYT